MNAFVLELLSPGACARLDDVVNFVGADASGQFGLRAHHEHFITALAPGLARLQRVGGDWLHLAQPGASLRFAGNRLTLATRDYVLGADHDRVAAALRERFAAGEAALAAARANLLQIEREMFLRLWELERSAP